MRFLLIVDSVESPQAINPQLGRRLAACLADLGHQVHLLELWDGETAPPAPAGAGTPNGVVLHDLPFPDERLMNRALENGAKQGSPVPLRLARLAMHPTAVGAAFRQLVLHKPRRVEDTRREIERLDAIYHFNCVAAVTAPYRAAFALEQAARHRQEGAVAAGPLRRQPQLPGAGRLGAGTAAAARRGHRLCHPPGPARLPVRPAGPLPGTRCFELAFPALVPPTGRGWWTPAAAAGPSAACSAARSTPRLRTPDFALELFAQHGRPRRPHLTMVGRGWEHFAPQADGRPPRAGRAGRSCPARCRPPTPRRWPGRRKCCSAWATRWTTRSPASCLSISAQGSRSCT